MNFLEKQMAIKGTYKYLKQQGFKFKNNTARNAFIVEFLKLHRLPVNTVDSPNYNAFAKNAMEVQKKFGAFVRYCNQKQAESLDEGQKQ